MKDYLNTVMDIVRHESPRLLKQYLVQNPNWTLREKGFNNYTPVMEAVSLERLEMVVTICDYVKSSTDNSAFVSYINESSSDGKNTILIATCMNHQTEVLEYLISNGANYSKKDNTNKGVKDYSVLSASELIEKFWANFDPKKYEQIIKHNVDLNTVRKRSGGNRGMMI